MYRHRGGKQIISKFVMRILHRTDAIFTNWMEKGFAMR